MSKVNSGQAPSTLIPKYIGTDFDKVVTVSDNIDAVIKVGDAIEGGGFNDLLDNIAEIVTVSDNIDAVVAVADGMEEINSVLVAMPDITVVSDNMGYVQDVANGLYGMPSAVFTGANPPVVNPLPDGATWFCTTNGRTYIWYRDADSVQWVESTPQNLMYESGVGGLAVELDFPANPRIDDEYVFGNLLYVFDGQKWTTFGTGTNPVLELKDALASIEGASLVGTASGLTVQEELNMVGTGGSLEAIRRSYADAGFTANTAESFVNGGTLDTAAEVLLDSALVGWSWGGAFPKVVPPNSTPENSGGIGAGAWVSQANTILRTQAKAYIDAADAQLQVNIDNKAALNHVHDIADVTSLQAALDGKSPTSHTHTPASIGAAATAHTHAIADVTNLQTTLDGKSATSHTHTAAQVGAAPAVHTHAEYVLKAGDVMTGNLSAPDFYVTSDKRLKYDLVPLTHALDKVITLQAYEYLKASTFGGKPTIKEVGILADDLLKVLPTGVTTQGTHAVKTISQSAMIALLVEAVKELKELVDKVHGTKPEDVQL